MKPLKRPHFSREEKVSQIVTFDNFNYFEGYENCFPTDAIRGGGGCEVEDTANVK